MKKEHILTVLRILRTASLLYLMVVLQIHSSEALWVIICQLVAFLGWLCDFFSRSDDV